MLAVHLGTSDEPTLELVREGSSPGVEVVVERISVEVCHSGHVEIRKPAEMLDDAQRHSNTMYVSGDFQPLIGYDVIRVGYCRGEDTMNGFT